MTVANSTAPARTLEDIAQALVGNGRGLLAMDESVRTCNRRFAGAGIGQTEEIRRRYRELLITTPRLDECISGVILHDETLRQAGLDGTPFLQVLASLGIIAGIKVDAGTGPLALHPGEMVTEGLDGLRARLQEYHAMGARFAKWRAVFAVGSALPTTGGIEANAHTLGRYAAMCQEAGLVPIIEPEVLMVGNHTMRRCGEVTREVLWRVFEQMHRQGIALEGLLLKANMVLPGLDAPPGEAAPVQEAADATLACLLETVPPAVAGVVFLAGGQSAELASARLNALNIQAMGPRARVPWTLSFSFARAIQQPAMQIWHGDMANVVSAQRMLLHRAACNRAALSGDYDATVEHDSTGSLSAHRSLQAAQ